MEETLYDKMLEKTEGYVSPEMSQKQAEYLAKDCANIGIQAQIDLLENQKNKVLKWRKETSDLCLFSDTASFLKTIKIETIDLFLLLINEDILELKNQLFEK